MEFCQLPADKRGKVRKSFIPWHYQKRYQASLDQCSFNQTLTRALYNRKLKSLLHNNKCLALALESCRRELSDKENVVIDNAKNIDIINFSSLKLKGLSDNLKKFTASIDETISLLQSHTAANPVTSLQCISSASRNVFKQRFQALSNTEPLKEVVESLENESNFSSVNEVHVFSNKNTTKNLREKHTIGGNSRNLVAYSSYKKGKSAVQKSKKPISKPQNAKLSGNVSRRTFKPVPNDTPPSYLLGLSSDSESFMNPNDCIKLGADCKTPKKRNPPRKPKRKQLNNEQRFSPELPSTNIVGKTQYNPKDPEVESTVDKVIESVVNEKTKKIILKKTESNSKVGKYVPRKKAKVNISLDKGTENSPNSGEDMFPSKGKFSENVEVLTDSSIQMNLEALETDALKTACNTDICYKNDEINNGIKGILKHNTGIKSIRDFKFQCETSNIKFNCVLPNELENEAFNANVRNTILTDQYSGIRSSQPRVILKQTDLTEIDPLQTKPSFILNENFDSPNRCKKVVILESNAQTMNVEPAESPTFCHRNKVHVHFKDDDEIELLNEVSQPINRPKVKKSKKRPLKESKQNLVPLPLKNRKPILMPTVKRTLTTDEIKDKNTFIVTAEIHQPPDGYTPKKGSSLKNIDFLNMQPSVILTDIFKCEQKKSIIESIYLSSKNKANNQLATQMAEKTSHEMSTFENTLCNNLDNNSDEENNICAQNFVEEDRKENRRRSKVISYTEMKLNTKMRRC